MSLRRVIAVCEYGRPWYEVFIRAKGPNQWFPVGPMVGVGASRAACLTHESLKRRTAAFFKKTVKKGVMKILKYIFRSQAVKKGVENEIGLSNAPFKVRTTRATTLWR